MAAITAENLAVNRIEAVSKIDTLWAYTSFLHISKELLGKVAVIWIHEADATIAINIKRHLDNNIKEKRLWILYLNSLLGILLFVYLLYIIQI